MNKETRVGVMFAVALAILAATVYLVGNFKESLDFKIRFCFPGHRYSVILLSLLFFHPE